MKFYKNYGFVKFFIITVFLYIKDSKLKKMKLKVIL